MNEEAAEALHAAFAAADGYRPAPWERCCPAVKKHWRRQARTIMGALLARMLLKNRQ